MRVTSCRTEDPSIRGEVDSETAGGIHGLPDEGEDIRVFTLPFDEDLFPQGGEFRTVIGPGDLADNNGHG